MRRSMRHKTIMIPLAAVMVMGMGTGSVLAAKQNHKQNFTEEQLDILEEARELFRLGDLEAGEALLKEAGIHKPHKKPNQNYASQEDREAVQEALEYDDYEAFLEIVQNGPFGEVVTEEIFEVLVEAHELRGEGEKRRGKKSFSRRLGIKRGYHEGKLRERGSRGNFQDLTEEQQEVVRALRNDREAIRAYFEEEGVERGR